MKMSQIRKIRGSWLYNSEGYAYEAIPGSLTANDERNSIRFEFREIDGEDSNFEVVIFRTGNEYHFKTDYYDHPLEELPLKEFGSPDESILFYKGKYGVAYFHLIL